MDIYSIKHLMYLFIMVCVWSQSFWHNSGLGRVIFLSFSLSICHISLLDNWLLYIFNNAVGQTLFYKLIRLTWNSIKPIVFKCTENSVVPQNIHVHAEYVNVNSSFGNKLFSGVVKVKWDHVGLGLALIQSWCIHKQKNLNTDIHKEKLVMQRWRKTEVIQT